MYDNEAAKVGAQFAKASPPDDNMSMSIQKIENGFLINTVGNKDGKFFQRITFVEFEWRLGAEVERLWTDFHAKPIESVAPLYAPVSLDDGDDVPF